MMTRIEIKDAPPLKAEELRRMDAYWRAAKVLSHGVGPVRERGPRKFGQCDTW